MRVVYLIIDGFEGEVLAEVECLEDAVGFLASHERDGRDVFVARFDDVPGELLGMRSVVTIRVPGED